MYAATSPWTQTDWSGGSGQTSWSDNTKFSSASSADTSTAGQATLSATSNWYNTSWKYRQKITISSSITNSDLTNFPALIKLTDSGNNLFASAQADGDDILFTSSDGTTKLDHEIEKYDAASGSEELDAWVRIPTLSSSTNTDIYVYYGNASAASQQNATGVWDANYAMVQHMNQDPSGTAPQMLDSTSNNNDGTSGGSMTSGDQVAGQVDGSLDFDGSDDYVDISHNENQLNLPLTISVWVKSDVINQGNWRGIVSKYIAGSKNGWNIDSSNGGYYFYYWKDASNYIYNGGYGFLFSSATTSQSHLVAVVRTSGLTIYLNGNQVTTGSWTGTAGNATQTADLQFGRITNGNLNFDGTIDEVRISNTARSADWIAASYNNQNSPATYLTYASEEDRYVSSATITSSIFDTAYTAGAAWGTLTYTATTPTNTSVTVKARTSNSSSMSGATAFSSCTTISSGTDISGNSCVTDSHRYIQYQVSLSTSDTTATPTFSDILINFATYDATAPSISLTALSPDPNSDNTPSLAGTATEAIGTVSNVQYQMDGTSGTWTACTADDGTFDEATEAFTCTASALSDGSHTMYVRATDSNSNTTATADVASDAFTIDTTAPAGIDLNSPGSNNYTNAQRPTFKWKATTDLTSGLSKYKLEIDNAGDSGDFVIDNIPVSRTTDYETDRYKIVYENFSDADSTNNYISVYTKSSSDWADSTNDGKLKEGKITWKVTARDNAGNETNSSRTLFVDKTSPTVAFTQVNNTAFADNLSTTDTTPTVYGKITDPLSMDSSSSPQNDDGPKVASGPKEVEIKLEKKTGLTYKLHTIYTININTPWWACTDKKIADNAKQTCDKYIPFEYTPEQNLERGKYKVTVTGKDTAGNPSTSSGQTSFTLNITSLSQITTRREKEVIEQEIKKLPQKKQEKVKDELEITKAIKPNVIEKTASKAKTGGKNVVRAIVGGVVRTIEKGVTVALNTQTGTITPKVPIGTGSTAGVMFGSIKYTLSVAGQGLAYAGQKANDGTVAIGQGYMAVARSAPGVTKTILTSIGDGVGTVAHATTKVVRGATAAVGSGVDTTLDGIASVLGNTAKTTKQGVASTVFAVGEKTQDVSDTAGFTIVKLGYLFIDEPTRISDVKAVILSSTSAKVTWSTNHPATGKVNYGFSSGEYTRELQTDKRTTDHEFILKGLTPGTRYHYEVMSQNKNYVYDANREFVTPK